MTIQQFLLVLRARFKVAFIALISTVAIVSFVSLLLPKKYTSTAAVVVDVKSPDPVSGMALQGLIAPGYMATQIDIINSDRVAQSVVGSLKMDLNPTIQKQWFEATKGKGNLKEWLSDLLKRDLEVKPARDSNVIAINYSGSDPVFASTMANAFAQAYIDVNLDLRLAPARQYASFFDEQTKAARTKLEAAQKALSTYQQQNGITATDERLDFEVAKLNETSSQLTNIQGLTTDSQSKRNSGRPDTVSEVMQSSLINSLKADIARLEAKLAETNGNYGKNHPQTLRTEGELATLKAQLDAETRKITSSIETTYQVGRQREAQLQGSLAAQKARVLTLNKQRDELNVLRRDIESAQRSFEIVSQRAAQSNIESQTTQTNISVLNPAFPAASPSKPRIFLNIFISIFLGTLLGIAVALLLELNNRRIRSAEDLIEALEIPLLGTISAAKGERKFPALRSPL